MCQFTLYVFTRVFHFRYTTDSSTASMTNLFIAMKSNSLVGYVIGKRNCGNVISVIDCYTQKAEEATAHLSREYVEQVYKSVLHKSARTLTKQGMLEELMIYSMQFDQEIQRAVYDQRSSEKVKKYIASLTCMIRTHKRIRQKEVLADSSPLPSDAMMDDKMSYPKQEDFLTYIVKNIDSLTKFRLICNVEDDWTNPVSIKYIILKRLSEANIPIQILLASRQRQVNLLKDWNNPNGETIGRWICSMQEYQNVEIRLINCILLHDFVYCKWDTQQQPMAQIGMYMYGASIHDVKPTFYISPPDERFSIFTREYEYLWTMSEGIQQSIVKQEKFNNI